ncbi:MAG: tRNA 2-selenouridine(34) synthase MnmH [Arenicella sp.]|nr:tRNA 2-selenouridine(34) synthase MnmH [Arenicella sp.]
MPDSKRDDLSAEQFSSLFLKDVALMDVRAPVEFCAGTFPTSTNLPLLDDQQRHLIGTEYAEHGQPAAIDFGLRLASPDIRAQRISSWKQFIADNPGGYLYCFRGGLRSKTTQQWLADAGIHYPLVEGGYKALRRYLLEQLTRLCKQGNIILLSGATGVGKTELIDGRLSAVDIEGRANHRGSAFGKTFESQPAQIDWENQIIIDWLRCEARSDAPVLIEAESHLIGRIHLPKVLQEAMASAPVLLLQASMADRAARLYQDYVEHSLRHYRGGNDDPCGALYDDALDSLQRIKKRLGGLKFQQMSELLSQATSLLRERNDSAGFYQFIEMLLTEYYDALYQHYQTQSEPRLVLRGNWAEITDWLESNQQSTQGHSNAVCSPASQQAQL